MSRKQYKKEKKRWDKRAALVKERKLQIARWMSNHSKKTLPTKLKVDVNEPATVLLAHLTKTGLQKPRRRAAYNVWATSHKEAVDAAYARKAQSKGIDITRGCVKIDMRSKIIQNLFAQLPEHKKEKWERKAEEEHEAALEEWTNILTGEPATDNESRQKCIENLIVFLQPIADLVASHTGMVVSVIVGGPEPADGGRLNVLSVHSGATPGPVQMNFGQAERAAYKEVLVPVFSRFLKKVYSVEECRQRALRKKTFSLTNLVEEDNNPPFEVHRGAAIEGVEPRSGKDGEPVEDDSSDDEDERSSTDEATSKRVSGSNTRRRPPAVKKPALASDDEQNSSDDSLTNVVATSGKTPAS
ncbi:hypothetical protein NLJ89_g8319 [Agrocybe chaxingu]|uniref:Uncharacterized protein n=1 Tax=Agrocybe chaxingu TaxID=84603 RepID=A0A9W8MSV5_9AGAR|nr:hypothetical protein NLJ89_g8319 [Agrocybe chaxingu]